MKEQIINNILTAMQTILNNAQLRQLMDTLRLCLLSVTIVNESEEDKAKGPDNLQLLSLFLDAKRVEGCSEKTVRYYETTLKKLFDGLNMPLVQLSHPYMTTGKP